ncbi:hypothetical protein GCM10023350_26210 [Nocardioides endophyticus]|uniref:DUF998 domain-containing protein n=1 Tax=Nocardioides endophyticus TaxID=1353775 RepID=A0ABP8YWF9_9ACTN
MGVSRVRRHPWAVLAVLGGALSATLSGYAFAEYAGLRWLDSTTLLDWSARHEALHEILGWLRVAGVVLIAIAFALRSRTRTAPAAAL